MDHWIPPSTASGPIPGGSPHIQLVAQGQPQVPVGSIGCCPYHVGQTLAPIGRKLPDGGLSAELERRRVPLLVANLPGANFDGANGRYMFGQLSLAAQLQRDLDSEWMTGGLVVEKRGRDKRPGRHEPILDEAQYARTTAAIAVRRRIGNKPKPFRTYALRGLLFCICGTRLRGEAHVQRGTEIRYYRCPTIGCKARRCPGEAIEAEVLALIGTAALPNGIVDAAQAELRKRLQTPAVADVGRQRARLTKRLEQIKKQNG